MRYSTINASILPDARPGDVLYFSNTNYGKAYRAIVSRRHSATELRIYPFTWWRWAWYRTMRLFYR